MTQSYNDIIHFWFSELTPQDWWKKDEQFDQSIKDRFGSIHDAAIGLELYSWRETAKGCLAEVIVLDQFSRNIYRNQPQSFAYDGIALALAQSAIDRGMDQALSTTEKSFLYMPYMHSESLVIHDVAVRLFDQPELENTLSYEHRHRDIIQRFGRYPHRNHILGRESTPEEIAFLATENSSF